MTISATTQGLRMGVATSSSRPVAPFDGQVISETDTDSLQVYKGSAWAPVSGLTLISKVDLAGVSTASINNCFSATYKNYRVVVECKVSSATDREVNFRLRAGGTDNSTASSYVQQIVYGFSSTVGASTVSLTYLLGESINNAAGGILQASIELANPFVATPTSNFTDIQGHRSTTATLVSIRGGYHTQSVSYDGITIFDNSSSNFTSGTMWVYGWANS